jgi:hypothetical protein
MKKYPRTYHLPFSPEIHSDDKVCNVLDLQKIIDDKTPVVITVKADGGNCACSPSGVFARTHTQETSCPSFNYIKNVHYYPNVADIIKDKVVVFGENMFAIHSIEYNNLTDYFYVFNIVDQNTQMFMSHQDVLDWATAHGMQMVPTVYEGVIPSLSWLERFLATELKKPCELGDTREGFVVRVSGEFFVSEFSKNVFKYVRAGHVATNEHWSRNWKQAKLNKGS